MKKQIIISLKNNFKVTANVYINSFNIFALKVSPKLSCSCGSLKASLSSTKSLQFKACNTLNNLRSKLPVEGVFELITNDVVVL